jgi:hypothetical protein
VAKKIFSISGSRDCQPGSSIKRTTRMMRLVPALLCAPPPANGVQFWTDFECDVYSVVPTT